MIDMAKQTKAMNKGLSMPIKLVIENKSKLKTTKM